MKKSLATFWWMDADRDAFLDYAERFGSIIAFSSPWKVARSEVRPLVFRDALKSSIGSSLLFGRSDQFSDSQIVEHVFPESGQRFNVTAEDGNLMWWRHDRRSDGKVTLCTIGFYSERFDCGSRTCEPKDHEFVKWASAVMRWVRARTPEKEGFYRASTLIRSAKTAGAVQLADY